MVLQYQPSMHRHFEPKKAARYTCACSVQTTEDVNTVQGYLGIFQIEKCQKLLQMQSGDRESDTCLTSTAVVSSSWKVHGNEDWPLRWAHETWGMHNKARSLRDFDPLAALSRIPHAGRLVPFSWIDRHGCWYGKVKLASLPRADGFETHQEPQSASREDRAHGDIDHLCPEVVTCICARLRRGA